MKKKLTVITLATAIVIGSPFNNNYSYAESTEDLTDIQEQRNNIQEDLSAAEARIADVLNEIEVLNREINVVNQTMLNKQEQISQTEQDMARMVSDINNLQDEIKELETSIAKRQEILKNRIASYQQTGGSINYLEVIFGSSSFGDFISRVTSVNKIVESDASLIEQLESDIKKVEENKELALNKLDELNTMKIEQEETLKSITNQQQQIEQSKKVLENKQYELSSLVEELESKDSNLASMEKEVQQRIAAVQKAAEEKAQEKAQENSASNPVESKNEENGNLEPKSKVAKSSTSENKKQNTDEKFLTMTATAYTVKSAGGSGVTATGINLKKNPNSKVIAVDPSVIPLGTLVQVEGYGYAIAGDIGSAIKGNKIDVFVPTSKEALNWGVRKVKVTIQ